MQIRKIKLKVYSKVNLSLNILKAKDNLHLLDTIMASVDIADVITVARRNDGKINTTFSLFDGQITNSSVDKIIKIIAKDFDGLGADIFIEKGIPLSGGLGGSSADAAGVAFAFDKIFNLTKQGLNMPLTALEAGSDVPFMLEGGFCRVKGKGELVERLVFFKEISLVICKDKNGVSAKQSYEKFDEIYPSKSCILTDNDAFVSALKNESILDCVKYFSNALEKGSIFLEPQIQGVLNELKRTNAVASFMSGSGSACVGVFESFDGAKQAEKELIKKGLFARAVKTKPKGIEII